MVATAPTQAPAPTSVEVYEFSYSRSTGRMRFRLDGREWLVKSLVGKAESIGVNAQGNWELRCRLLFQDETAYLYLSPDADERDVITDLPETHWRLCYNRAGSEADKRPHWRLRDERTQQLYSNDIRDYRGIVALNWLDAGPHVFHDGKVAIDAEGVAHFAP